MITVFTPTYNRAYIIDQLYQSLLRQTCHAFEWLIVDDGSVDNTKELIAKWCEAGNPFPIRYFRQENGGKCRAINKGLDLAIDDESSAYLQVAKHIGNRSLNYR